MLRRTIPAVVLSALIVLPLGLIAQSTSAPARQAQPAPTPAPAGAGGSSSAAQALASLKIDIPYTKYVLRNGLTLMNVQAFYQLLATGLIILVAMMIDRVTRGRG